MTREIIEDNKKEHRNKSVACWYGMHPAGGFVAWPDGRTTTTEHNNRDIGSRRCRGNRRKGFVAWPEKE